MSAARTYSKLLEFAKETASLQSVAKLLSWDQQTYMPSRASESRSEQRALIARIIHERIICEEYGDLLAELDEENLMAELGPEAAANVRELRRVYDRNRNVPPSLVDEIEKAIGLADQEWRRAREEEDFSILAPRLERIVSLKQDWADAVGFEGERYDALIDIYEPGAKARDIFSLFESLRSELTPLAEQAIAKFSSGSSIVFDQELDPDALAEFSQRLAEGIGFDFNAGRMDQSIHPFCSGINSTDVRVTTAVNKSNPLDSLLAIIHEVGHGLYYQGHFLENRGTPMGAGASTGVHESQARWWENFVGRSHSFWVHFFPELQTVFSGPFDDVSLEEFLFAINRVRASLIRVEADEITYNLHVVLRCEIERELINGGLAVRDLPEIWNAKMVEYLGISPQNDVDGVLQDIHWPHGMFGYFPTYTLGNIYAAQLDESMRTEISDVDGLISMGQFDELLEWLRRKIHRLGGLYPPDQLIRKATGSKVDTKALIRYLINRYLD